MAVTQRQRTFNLKQLIAAGGFGPVVTPNGPADDLPGYTIKKIIDDARSKHMVNIVNVEPNMGKYKHFHDNAETVIIILEGEGEFLLDDVNTAPIKPGTLIHSYPGEVHGTRNTGNVALRYLVVEGPLPVDMQRDMTGKKPLVTNRKRVIDLPEYIAAGGFGPIMTGDKPDDDLPGYTVKFIARPDDAQAKHLVNVVNVEAGFKKYNHWHNNAETVLYFLQGEGEFVIDENNTVPIKAGDVAHSFPGEVHGTRNTGTVPLRYVVVEGPLPLDMNKA